MILLYLGNYIAAILEEDCNPKCKPFNVLTCKNKLWLQCNGYIYSGDQFTGGKCQQTQLYEYVILKEAEGAVCLKPYYYLIVGDELKYRPRKPFQRYPNEIWSIVCQAKFVYH